MRQLRQVPAELRNDLQSKQFGLLINQIPTLYAVLLVNTAVLCYSVYGLVSFALSVIFPGVFASLIVIRLLAWGSRRGSRPTDQRVSSYLVHTTVIAGLVSTSLGVWGVALLISGIGDRPFVPLFIGFGAIACAYCLASLPRAAFATIFCATSPVILALMTSGNAIEVAAGVNLLLIFLLILRIVGNQYDQLVDSVISHARVKTLADTDPLTGLANRRAFIEALDAIVRRSSGDMTKVAVAMIDLDGFKAINDTYGHAAGDEVLIQAARRIKAAPAGCHMIARLGGDEFAILIVCNDNLDLADDVGAVLVREMGQPVTVAGTQIRLGVSIGFAVATNADVEATAIMSRADMALYYVKHDGGGGVATFAESMDVRVRRQTLIEQALRETDQKTNITIVYQPIFNSETREITSFEALARWDHPELGIINPMEFIGVAEKSGTIAALTERILGIAIKEAANWNNNIGLSVNISGVDLCRATTPLMIMSILNKHKLDPRRLLIEVTETSVLSDFFVARRQIGLLRRSGIRVALDDFGSGFASIKYLKEITFDRVKIDGDLIADITESREARLLLKGVLQLCSAIGVPTTAEKVETEEQLAVLIDLKCDRVQGYLLGKPVSGSDAGKLAGATLRAA